jgi:hypothetical protein
MLSARLCTDNNDYASVCVLHSSPRARTRARKKHAHNHAGFVLRSTPRLQTTLAPSAEPVKVGAHVQQQIDTWGPESWRWTLQRAKRCHQTLLSHQGYCLTIELSAHVHTHVRGRHASKVAGQQVLHFSGGMTRNMGQTKGVKFGCATCPSERDTVNVSSLSARRCLSRHTVFTSWTWSTAHIQGLVIHVSRTAQRTHRAHGGWTNATALHFHGATILYAFKPSSTVCSHRIHSPFLDIGTTRSLFSR